MLANVFNARGTSAFKLRFLCNKFWAGVRAHLRLFSCRGLMRDRKINNYKYKKLDLKTPLNRSHNRGCSDERIIALVKYMARKAAEKDLRKCAKNPEHD